jgi:hypothetical protein
MGGNCLQCIARLPGLKVLFLLQLPPYLDELLGRGRGKVRS